MGCVGGGILPSTNFTVQKGDFIFSTQNDIHAMQLLKDGYKERAKLLREKSIENLKAFESNNITDEAKRQLVEYTIDLYLTPTSRDNIFSRDVVIFNGEERPTILVREDFNEIKDNWARLLSLAQVKRCVDNHRDGEQCARVGTCVPTLREEEVKMGRGGCGEPVDISANKSSRK